jgi:hypothetical protein
VVSATAPGGPLDSGVMSAMVSGVVLIAGFAALAGLAAILAMAAFRRAGAREASSEQAQS